LIKDIKLESGSTWNFITGGSGFSLKIQSVTCRQDKPDFFTTKVDSHTLILHCAAIRNTIQRAP